MASPSDRWKQLEQTVKSEAERITTLETTASSDLEERWKQLVADAQKSMRSDIEALTESTRVELGKSEKVLLEHVRGWQTRLAWNVTRGLSSWLLILAVLAAGTVWLSRRAGRAWTEHRELTAEIARLEDSRTVLMHEGKSYVRVSAEGAFQGKSGVWYVPVQKTTDGKQYYALMAPGENPSKRPAPPSDPAAAAPNLGRN